MTSEEFQYCECSGIFNHKELYQISVVSELIEELKIFFGKEEILGNDIAEIEISLTPITKLEDRVTRADIEYISMFNNSGDMVNTKNSSDIFLQNYSSLVEPIVDSLKEINYEYINNSIGMLHIKELLKIKNDETLEDSVSNILLSDDIRKKIQVALLSHALVEDDEVSLGKKKSPKV